MKYGLWTVDCGPQTGYKRRTTCKMRTGKYELGIAQGLGIKRGLWTVDRV